MKARPTVFPLWARVLIVVVLIAGLGFLGMKIGSNADTTQALRAEATQARVNECQSDLRLNAALNVFINVLQTGPRAHDPEVVALVGHLRESISDTTVCDIAAKRVGHQIQANN
jgi:hypothetical protein